jgi:hypothetical protein
MTADKPVVELPRSGTCNLYLRIEGNGNRDHESAAWHLQRRRNGPARTAPAHSEGRPLSLAAEITGLAGPDAKEGLKAIKETRTPIFETSNQ